jgi:hypothetical protein
MLCCFVSMPMQFGKELSLCTRFISGGIVSSHQELGFWSSLIVAHILKSLRLLLQFGIFGMHEIKLKREKVFFTSGIPGCKGKCIH